MTSKLENPYSNISRVPLLPLEAVLLLPRVVLPLQLFEARYLQLFHDTMGADRLVGVIQPEIGDTRDYPRLSKVGTLGRITHFEEIEEQRYFVGITGISRFALKSDRICDKKLYRIGEIDLDAFSFDHIAGFGENQIDRDRFVKLLKSYAKFANFELDWEAVNETRLEDLVNSCSMASPHAAQERQALLEAESLATRAEILIALAEIAMARKAANITMQ